jgi:NADH-quinone oxidoreductase subunit M
MLWMFQRVMFGKLDNPKNQKLEDLNGREIAIMLPLVFLIFFMGFYPAPFINKMAPALDKVIERSRIQPAVLPQAMQITPQGLMQEGQPVVPGSNQEIPVSHPAMPEANPGMPAGNPAVPAAKPAGHP